MGSARRMYPLPLNGVAMMQCPAKERQGTSSILFWAYFKMQVTLYNLDPKNIINEFNFFQNVVNMFIFQSYKKILFNSSTIFARFTNFTNFNFSQFTKCLPDLPTFANL